MAEYRFLTTWLLDAAIEPVWDAIHEIEAWPSWWRGVESVTKLSAGDGNGIGWNHHVVMRWGECLGELLGTRLLARS